MNTARGAVAREYALQLEALACKHRHFGVTLNDDSASEPLTSATVTSAVRRVLRPIVSQARFCRVYNLKRGQKHHPDETRRFVGLYVKRRRGGLIVDLSAPGVLDDDAFWVWAAGRGADAVIGVLLQEIDAPQLFAATWDPNVWMNMGGFVAPAAIRFAREATQDAKIVCFVPKQTAYTVGVEVFAAADVLTTLAEAAVRHAKFTTRYLYNYGRIWVAAFDQQEAWDWLSELEKAPDIARFILETFASTEGEIEDARVDGRALAAAEVVAALGGRPHAELPEAVANWVAGQAALSPEVVGQAQQAVARVARRSLVPQRWLAEETRDEWRKSLVQLQSRLAGEPRARPSAPSVAASEGGSGLAGT